jgi:hypothetical protein
MLHLLSTYSTHRLPRNCPVGVAELLERLSRKEFADSVHYSLNTFGILNLSGMVNVDDFRVNEIVGVYQPHNERRLIVYSGEDWKDQAWDVIFLGDTFVCSGRTFWGTVNQVEPYVCHKIERFVEERPPLTVDKKQTAERVGDERERLWLNLDFWTDFVGAFDPKKVLSRLIATFPESEFDRGDLSRIRLFSELEHWKQNVADDTQRESMNRQSWNRHDDNGPAFRFSVIVNARRIAQGRVSRYSIDLDLDSKTTGSERESLVGFLKSLELGSPTMEVWDDKEA